MHNLHIKENMLNPSNMIFKLEHKRVEIESTGRKVIRLKLRDDLAFFNLESGDE